MDNRAEIYDEFIRLTAPAQRPAPAVADAMKRDSIATAVDALITVRPELDKPELVRLLAALGFLHGDELAEIEACVWSAVERLRDVVKEDEARSAWRDANRALAAIVGGAALH
ncbi:MAG: hypothetical protein ABSF67_22610 [Roseiarcus sp.]|jgi:hypothetical protein